MGVSQWKVSTTHVMSKEDAAHALRVYAGCYVMSFGCIFAMTVRQGDPGLDFGTRVQEMSSHVV